MSIIGNINSRAQQIRSKINLPKNSEVDQEVRQRASELSSQTDPLRTVALELSEEVESNKEEYVEPNNLEQTIIIGELEEGTIFDDLQMDSMI
jgi:hypothetical protein